MRAYALVARSDLSVNGRTGANGRPAAVPDALALEIHLGPLPLLHGQTLDGDRIKLLGIDDPSAKESATRGGLAAYLRLAELGLVHRDSDIASKGVFFDLGMDARISGNSAGLAFLAATAGWILEDYLRRSGKVCPVVSVAATGILPNVGATDQIRILSDPIKEVASLEAKIAAGRNAVGHQGYVMYPACAGAPEFAPDGRHIVVATANDAVDRIIELYGVRRRRRRLRRPVRRARTLPLAMAMAVVAVLTGWLLREKPPPPPPPPVPLTVTLFQESRSGEPVIVPPTASLRAGDGIRVRLELGSAGFAYLFDVDGHDRALQLFPVERLAEPLGTGAYWAPPDDKWWEVDERAGTERLLAAAATQHIGWLENLGQRIKQAESSPFIEQQKLVRELEETLVRERDAGRLTYVRMSFDHE